jgi:hypothetical protein
MTEQSPAARVYKREDMGDGRLHSPVFVRNNPPIIANLASLALGLKGNALEVGSGTGQHAAAMQLAFPDLSWTTSDPDPSHRQSAEAWMNIRAGRSHKSLALDASGKWWDDPEVQDLFPLSCIVSINVIHIAPPEVMEHIILGAGAMLDPGGILAFYGPFMENGNHTSVGNRDFDSSLRAQDPNWGIRDVLDILAAGSGVGLDAAAITKMPANNRIVALKKA